MGVVAILAGGLGQHIVREDGQRGSGEQSRRPGGHQGPGGRGRAEEVLVGEALRRQPAAGVFRGGWPVAGELDRTGGVRYLRKDRLGEHHQVQVGVADVDVEGNAWLNGKQHVTGTVGVTVFVVAAVAVPDASRGKVADEQRVKRSAVHAALHVEGQAVQANRSELVLADSQEGPVARSGEPADAVQAGKRVVGGVGVGRLD